MIYDIELSGTFKYRNEVAGKDEYDAIEAAVLYFERNLPPDYEFRIEDVEVIE